MKMPYKLKEKWRTVACKLMEWNQRHQVKMSFDPLFIDIRSTQPVQQKSQSKAKVRNSFTTTVVTNIKSIQCCETGAVYTNAKQAA